MHRLRRIILLVLAALLLTPAAYAEPYEHPYPDELQISVKTETWPSESHGDVSVDIPVTILDRVNARLRDAASALFSQADAHTDCRIDITAAYRVSGTAWAGFLLAGRAVLPGYTQGDDIIPEKTAALYYDVQAYNMVTGARLTLYDVFAEDSEAWALIRDAARTTLYGYYPGEERDEAALEEMISVRALWDCPFLPSAGRLLVPFRLQTILPDHPQIAYLILPYPDYRPLMLPQAQAQTDNSSRPMIILTFDDGPTDSYTPVILGELAHYGASATFFCLGKSVIKYPDMVRREADFGHTVAAHSMTHENPWEQPKDEMLAEYDTQKQLYQDVMGFPVTLFRPPGGDLKTYVTRQIGWPLIRWNKSGSDTGDIGASEVASRVIRNAENGDIVLVHDIRKKTADAVPMILEALTERGFMFATVDEMLYLNGVVPKPNVSYYDGFGVKTYPKQ
ncbi:MAG: polysaccharide deacetylase family protein [Clostridiales bacterium]|nr:polysaccharide deacetylase family protein [Clostridiales bacterium]